MPHEFQGWHSNPKFVDSKTWTFSTSFGGALAAGKIFRHDLRKTLKFCKPWGNKDSEDHNCPLAPESLAGHQFLPVLPAPPRQEHRLCILLGLEEKLPGSTGSRIPHKRKKSSLQGCLSFGYVLWPLIVSRVLQHQACALQGVSPCIKLRTLLPLENVARMRQSILPQEHRVLFPSTESCFLIHLVINCLEFIVQILLGRWGCCPSGPWGLCLAREVLWGSCLDQGLWYLAIGLRTC